MVEDVLTERFRLESVLVGKASAHKATLSAANGEFLQSLVEMAKDLPLRGRQALEALWSLAAAGRIEDLQTEGAEYLALLDQVIQSLASFNHPDLQGVGASLEQLRQEHKDNWPWCTDQDVAEARAEQARGECIELGRRLCPDRRR